MGREESGRKREKVEEQKSCVQGGAGQGKGEDGHRCQRRVRDSERARGMQEVERWKDEELFKKVLNEK